MPATRGTELYLPNRKTLQDLYVPPEIEIPEGDARCQVFDFGGPLDMLGGVQPLEVREQVWVFDRSMIVWGLCGTMVNAVAPGAVNPAQFQVQIFQSHKGNQWTWFNKHQMQNNVLGGAGLPFLLRSTHPVDVGDAVTVEVKSMVGSGGANTRIQVCLFGVVPAAPDSGVSR